MHAKRETIPFEYENEPNTFDDKIDFDSAERRNISASVTTTDSYKPKKNSRAKKARKKVEIEPKEDIIKTAE